jgi:hypothetical protein
VKDRPVRSPAGGPTITLEPLTPRLISGGWNHRIEKEMADVPKTVTLTDAGVDGEWDVEPLEGGRLLLSPHVGPSIDELDREPGPRLCAAEFSRRWGHLPSDGEG